MTGASNFSLHWLREGLQMEPSMKPEAQTASASVSIEVPATVMKTTFQLSPSLGSGPGLSFRVPLLLLALGSICCLLPSQAETRRLSRDELRDKIQGGWAGQMIGVSFGAPTESRSLGKIAFSWQPPLT